MDYIGIENITLVVNKIKNFVLDEIWVENLVKENIEVIFVES